MGFRYYGKGAFLACECDGDNIIVHRTSGEIAKYPTKLRKEIPLQTVRFIGSGVAFVLYDTDGVMYVGRNNGTITGYQGDLITRYTSWQAPSFPHYAYVGSIQGNMLYSLLLDPYDNRTLILGESDNEYVLDEPYSGYADEALTGSEAVCNPEHIILLRQGGQFVYDPKGKWAVPFKPERRDNGIFL